MVDKDGLDIGIGCHVNVSISIKDVLDEIGHSNSLVSVYSCKQNVTFVSGFARSVMHNVEEMVINNCPVRNLPSVYYTNTPFLRCGLRTHAALKILNLRSNNITTIADFAFYGLSNLEELFLGYNNIVHLQEDVFKGLMSLKRLELAFNKITIIDPSAIPVIFNNDLLFKIQSGQTPISAFCYFSQLEEVHLNYNMLTSFSNESLKVSEQMTQFTVPDDNKPSDLVPRLSLLSLQGNKISEIEDFEFISLGNLAKLMLGENRLTRIKAAAFAGPDNIKILALQKNKLRNIEADSFKGMFMSNKTHFTLNLGDNFIEQIEPGTFQNLNNLNYLLLDGNMISELREDEFARTTALVQLDLGSNKLTKVPEMLLDDMEELRFVSLDNNNIKELPVFFLRSTPNLWTVQLSFNKITENGLPAGLFDVPNLKTINLDSNNITRIPHNLFRDIPSLQTITLVNNSISLLYPGDFKNLPNLEVVNVSRNGLEGISPDTFVGLKSLDTLDFEGNSLQSFADFARNISTLFVKNDLSDSPGIEVDLRSNVMQCGCYDNMHVIYDLMIFHKLTIVSIHCYFSHDNTFWEVTAENLLSIFENCPQHEKISISINETRDTNGPPSWLLYVGIAVGAILIVVIIIVVRFCTQIQVACHKRYGLRIVPQLQPTKGKTYDAFICYSRNNEHWVMRTLVPTLENKSPPYRLCIHHRDSKAGANFADTLVNCIKQSQVTVLVLSEDFMNSDWCLLEFSSAHQSVLKTFSNKVIPILLEDISPHYMTSEMKSIMKSNRPIQVTDPNFWDKLYYALPDPCRLQSMPLRMPRATQKTYM